MKTNNCRAHYVRLKVSRARFSIHVLINEGLRSNFGPKVHNMKIQSTNPNRRTSDRGHAVTAEERMDVVALTLTGTNKTKLGRRVPTCSRSNVRNRMRPLKQNALKAQQKFFLPDAPAVAG